jgi:hypothetical protein
MEPKTWLVDSDALKHMTGYKEILSDLETKYFVEQVELGDEKCYKIEGVGSISFRLESGDPLELTLEDCTSCQDSQFMHCLMMQLAPASCGTEDLDIFITKLF